MRCCQPHFIHYWFLSCAHNSLSFSLFHLPVDFSLFSEDLNKMEPGLKIVIIHPKIDKFMLYIADMQKHFNWSAERRDMLLEKKYSLLRDQWIQLGDHRERALSINCVEASVEVWRGEENQNQPKHSSSGERREAERKEKLSSESTP